MKNAAILLILALLISSVSNARQSVGSAEALTKGPESFILATLNSKSNLVRRAILKERSDGCFAITVECEETYTHAEKNDYVFTKSDLVFFVLSGSGSSEDPCKSENCTGSDEEHRLYSAGVKSQTSGRWGSASYPIYLELKITKQTSQSSGQVSTHSFLSRLNH